MKATLKESEREVTFGSDDAYQEALHLSDRSQKERCRIEGSGVQSVGLRSSACYMRSICLRAHHYSRARSHRLKKTIPGGAQVSELVRLSTMEIEVKSKRYKSDK